MEVIIASLLAGCLLGTSKVINKILIGYLDKMVMLTVFVILMAVGLKIGSNHELIANLMVLGWQALSIATLSVAGSVGMLWLVSSKLGVVLSSDSEEKPL